MKINKQLFEDVLSGKLKGTFVLRNKQEISSNKLFRSNSLCLQEQPYILFGASYTPNGLSSTIGWKSGNDIVDFIPNTDMKENELTIEIPDGKIVDWEESKKQNKIVLKDKQLTYNDICRKLFVGYGWFFTDAEGGIHHTLGGNTYSCANNSTTKHQLECILAKNKLANVAKYLNDGWKPTVGDTAWYIISYGHNNIDIVDADFQHSHCSSRIIFKTKEFAQQAMKILGEETIKLALEPLGI